jgi:hypothetical protein
MSPQEIGGIMSTIVRLLFALVAILLFVFLQPTSHAETLKINISEFAEMDSLEAIELDESAKLKVNNLLPRLAKRFCYLNARPDSIAVSVGVVQVEWSTHRICEKSSP